jgi:hypothetical protein
LNNAPYLSAAGAQSDRVCPFDIKDLPEDVREGVLIDIYAPDDAVFPTEQSIKEPYESNGLFRGIRIDYEETERRTELVRQNLRELGHWNI